MGCTGFNSHIGISHIVNPTPVANRLTLNAKETDVHIERIRDMLLAPETLKKNAQAR
jgi:hypothetical protein